MSIRNTAIIGAGGWGTALAVLWSKRGNAITLWGNDPERAAKLRETRQKLSAIRPPSLGHAAQVSGITPADISIISIWLQKKKLAQPAGG